MNKQEYMKRLAQQLSYYEGSHQDIINNYDSIIDELLDEGLEMEDIISKLGKPGTLVDDIADELGLTYTEETKRSTSLPLWAKQLLILVGLLVLVPMILSLVFGVTRTLFGIVFGVVGFFTLGIFSTNSLWGISSLSIGFKTLSTLTALTGITSLLIITYFVFNWAIRLLQYIVNALSKTGEPK